MIQLIKKAVGSAGGKKSAAMLLLLVVLGVLLMTAGTELPRTDSPTSREKNIKALCEKVTSNGEVYAQVNTDGGEVLAIAVICRNGDDPALKLKITEMLSTLYCIPTARIYVTNFG